MENFFENALFKPEDRRYRIAMITPELLLECLFNNHIKDGRIHGVEVTLDGKEPPTDIKVQALCYDPMRNLVALRLWSSEWDVIDAYGLVPEVVFEVHSVSYRLDKDKNSAASESLSSEICACCRDEFIGRAKCCLKTVSWQGSQVKMCISCRERIKARDNDDRA